MATATSKTTKLSIPHTEEEGIAIAGVLEQREPNADTKGRRIALASPLHKVHQLSTDTEG